MSKKVAFNKTIKIGKFKVTVNGFKGKPYIHINDFNHDKSVTFSKEDFAKFIKKINKISNAVSSCEKMQILGNKKKVKKSNIHVQDEDSDDTVDMEESSDDDN